MANLKNLTKTKLYLIMNRYARQEIIETWDQEKLRNAKVLIIGAGTTGNEVAKNLALIGIGSLTIIDDDMVEEVNLSRCTLFEENDIGKPKAVVVAEKAKRLNPEIEATPIVGNAIYDLGNLEFQKFNAVVSCVDNLETRKFINENCYLCETPLVNVGIEGWLGNITTITPPFESCLECTWTDNEYEVLKQRYSCSKLGIKIKTEIAMVITTAAVSAGFASQEVVKIILGLVKPASNETIWFDSKNKTFLKWQTNPKEGCSHYSYLKMNDIKIAGEVDVNLTVENIIKTFVKNCSEYELKSAHEIVYSASCRNCGFKDQIKPEFLGKFERKICKKCNSLSITPDEITTTLKPEFTLKELGIPSNQLLELLYEEENEIHKLFLKAKSPKK